MDNNKIANQKVEVPSGMTLNDKDHINDLLSSLKTMAKDYVVILTEASNETLYNQYYEQFLNIITLQRQTYELMFRFGWYSLEKAPTNKINEKFQMLSQEFQELNNN